MKGRTALLVAAALLVIIVAIVIGWKLGQKGRAEEVLPQAELPEVELVEGSTIPVRLFFPGRGGRLFAEEREIAREADTRAQLERLLEVLLDGPESPGLYPALPSEITTGWTHLNPQGVAYIDLAVAGDVPFPAWGSRWEMLAVYSVVNTVMLNLPEISGVVILRNGQQQPSFAGHLDTSRPLLADQSLVEETRARY